MEVGIVEIALSITYKIKLPENVSKSSIYFTITKKNGFFISSTAMENFMWCTEIMTNYSRRMQLGDSIENIIKDMKKSSDPKGGYFCKEGKVNGFIHHLGIMLEKHNNLVKDKAIWNV